MSAEDPITPPLGLVQQWASEFYGTTIAPGEAAIDIATQAARWGADQELEACCEYMQHEDFHGFAKELRASRRPKPPSLNSIALQMLGTIERDARYLSEITDTIRKALEAFDD
jgi:hypothetical protein